MPRAISTDRILKLIGLRVMFPTVGHSKLNVEIKPILKQGVL
jgi:hypothetical protein